MKIETLKSKISHIQVSSSHINNEGILRMTSELMADANLTNFEKVMIINESTGDTRHLFVSEITNYTSYDYIIAPNSIAGTGDLITILSTATATVDEDVAKPILIDIEAKNK